MSALLQVIGREIRVRALMPATGAVTAIGLLLTAWLSEGGRNFDEIAETSLPFAGFFLAGGGILMGALILARDLEGSRSLFWLARPIGAVTAFFGKFVAALLLVFVTTLIVALPALIVEPGVLAEPFAFSGALVGFGVGCIALGATLGLLLRNRSAWFLAAAAVILGFGAASWAIAQPFILSLSWDTTSSFISAIVIVFVVALIVAHALAFIRGRHDARAQARILTLVLAGILGGALLVAGSFAAWLLSLDVDDFDWAYMSGRSGNAVILQMWRTAPVAWGRTFAVDLERGRSIPLETGAEDIAISPSRMFYANRISTGTRRQEILAVDLGEQPRTRTTGIIHTGYLSSLETPADGSRVALVGSNATVQVYDPAGKSLGSFGAAPGTSWRRVRFVEPDRLRIYEGRENDVVIREADLRSRSMRQIGSLPDGGIYGHAGNDRLILRAETPKRRGVAPSTFSLHDAASGALIFTFPPGTRSVLRLTDGGWAVAGEFGANNVARVSAAGEMVAAGRVGPHRVLLGGEIRPGVVSLVETRSGSGEDRRLILADASNWRVVKTIPNLRATSLQWWWRGIDEAGSPAARVFTRDGDLWAIDPATLEAKKVEIR